jgi:hypothetical protein
MGLEEVMRWENKLERVGEGVDPQPPPGSPLGMIDTSIPKDAADGERQAGLSSLDHCAEGCRRS